MNPISKPADPFESAFGAEAATVSDVGAWLQQLFFLPGDWLLWTLASYAPPIARFFELSTADYGGVFSGVVSALVWLALLILGSIAYTAVRDFDQALTARIVQLYEDARRRIRVAANVIAYRIRQIRTRRADTRRNAPAAEFSEEIDVSIAELRVLHAHAQLPPGYALSVSDVAAALGRRKHDVQQTLSRLKQLNLLNSTVGGLDGESAYTLTPAGRAFLQFRQTAATARRAAPSGTAAPVG
jgi:DNA-binding MarR family transcriptional regulator